MEGSKRKEEKILNFSRLQEEHAKAIRLSKERIDKWAQFKADYEALQARMYSLPDKLTHDIMVPFGKCAFVPGQLYDTNEVLVLLGDNWFVKRSVKQALEIAERRKQNVMKMLEEEKKQMSEWEARHTFTSSFRDSVQEHEDTVEIKEEYDEAKERKRKERRQWNIKSGYVPPPRPAFPKTAAATSSQTKSTSHDQSNVRDHPSSAKGSTDEQMLERGRDGGARGDKDEPRGPKTDDELWARLDELEREEEEYLLKEKEGEKEEDVTASVCEEKETATSNKEETERTTRTSEADTLGAAREKMSPRKKAEKLPSSTGSSKSTTLSSAGAPVAAAPLRISVKHSSTQPAVESTKHKKDDVIDNQQEGEVKALFNSPADIFQRFCKADFSDEDSSVVEEREASSASSGKSTSTGSPSTKKGVKWNPKLVEFSDGSKSEATGVVNKSSDLSKVGGKGERKKASGGVQLEPTKPPMAFTGQVIERFSPVQLPASTTATKKVSKFKASRKQ